MDDGKRNLNFPALLVIALVLGGCVPIYSIGWRP
jgi:hypothetical protein